MIVFRHLTQVDLKEVIDIELAKVRERLEERGKTLILTDDAKEFLIRKGLDLDYGARPLRRAIEHHVEDPLAEELLRGEFEGLDTITVEGIKNDADKVVRLNFTGSVTQAEPVAAAAEAPATRKRPAEEESE